MTLAWEKIVMWVLAIVILVVLIVYLMHTLGNNPDSVVGRLFAAFGSAGKPTS